MNKPRCTCGGGVCKVRDERGRFIVSTYVCAGCRRRVPWCYGAADNNPDLCDDCWFEAEGVAA